MLARWFVWQPAPQPRPQKIAICGVLNIPHVSYSRFVSLCAIYLSNRVSHGANFLLLCPIVWQSQKSFSNFFLALPQGGGCLGAVVTGRLKGQLFSGGGGLFRGLFRAGQ